MKKSTKNILGTLFTEPLRESLADYRFYYQASVAMMLMFAFTGMRHWIFVALQSVFVAAGIYLRRRQK
ncbi:MAG: hypothetical protein AABY22_26130 [Nanoarchaeota archaeon]